MVPCLETLESQGSIAVLQGSNGMEADSRIRIGEQLNQGFNDDRAQGVGRIRSAWFRAMPWTGCQLEVGVRVRTQFQTRFSISCGTDCGINFGTDCSTEICLKVRRTGGIQLMAQLPQTVSGDLLKRAMLLLVTGLGKKTGEEMTAPELAGGEGELAEVSQQGTQGSMGAIGGRKERRLDMAIDRPECRVGAQPTETLEGCILECGSGGLFQDFHKHRDSGRLS